jgi:hypothetical protein
MSRCLSRKKTCGGSSDIVPHVLRVITRYLSTSPFDHIFLVKGPQIAVVLGFSELPEPVWTVEKKKSPFARNGAAVSWQAILPSVQVTDRAVLLST